MRASPTSRPGLRALVLGLSLAFSLAQSACSVLSPIPLWEVAKAGGIVVSTGLGASRASNTVYHPHPAFEQLCIEYNRDVQISDLVPALQIELRKRKIDSRVFESGTPWEHCEVWLRYTADLEWGVPPLTEKYKPYMTALTLTLRSGRGDILSSSQYVLNEAFSVGRWASTRDKVSPVVAALITGTEP